MTQRARRFARRLGVEHPIVSAGMALVALPELVCAVSEAGALGVLGAGMAPPPRLAGWLAEIRSRTARPFGVNLIVETTPAGPAATEEHVALLCSERVPLVVFHWNLPPEAWRERLRDAGARLWMTVGSREGATAAAALGFDALVVQGAEAGGHNRSQTPLAELVPQVVAEVDPLPVVAAGGIGDGRSAAAALALGASAVSVGTRFLASDEAWAHPEYKQRIVKARAGDTAATRIFGPEWPDQPMRVIRNRAVEQAERGEPGTARPIGRTRLHGLDYEMPPRSAVLPTPDTEGDLDEMCLAAGESAGLVDEIRPAARIVADLVAGMERALAGSRSSG